MIPRAGDTWWDRLTARFGRKNALDELALLFGTERSRGWLLWESNESLRNRCLAQWNPNLLPAR